MAKFDQGGGCACGLYAECETDCEHNKKYIRPKTPKDIKIEQLENLLYRVWVWAPVIELYDDGGLAGLRKVIGEITIELLHTKYAVK